MHSFNLVNVLPSLDNIEVEFIPAGGCCNLRTRKFSKRGEVETIDSSGKSIDDEEPSKADSEVTRSIWRQFLHQTLRLMYERRHPGQNSIMRARTGWEEDGTSSQAREGKMDGCMDGSDRG